MNVDLSSYINSWYNPGGTAIKCFLWYFFNFLFFKNAYNPISGIKVKLLKIFGAKVGTNVTIKPAVNIKYPWNLTIGNNVWIGENVWIDNLAKVVIEDNVCISQGSMLLCGNHNYKRTTFDLMIGDIILKEGCWVGAKSVVCPGITLETHAVLGVNSVANRDLEPYYIYQGNPAQKVRYRNIES